MEQNRLLHDDSGGDPEPMTTVLQEPGPGTVMLAGDWHGNTGWATSLIASAGIRDIPVVLQLGDFGYWVPGRRTDTYLDAIETACVRHGVTVLWVDGNHECVDHTTRLVTQRGFVAIEALRPGDEVMSLSDDGETLWERPTAIVRKHFTGTLHGIESRRTSMRVTPGHRVVGLALRSPEWVEYAGDDFENHSFKLVNSGINRAPDHPDVSDDDLRLMAWCLTDSSRKPVTRAWPFHQRESAAGRITELLDRLSIPYTRSVRHRHVDEICGRKVQSTQPEVTVSVPARESRDIPWSHTELDPVVWKLSRRQVGVLLEELVFCDGSIATSGKTAQVLYTSMNDRWSDQLQVLLVSNGYRVKRTVFRGTDVRLNICESTSVQVTAKHRAAATSFVTEKYDGEVWCVAMPSGRFFAERNGTVFLTGNCFASLYELPIDPTTGLRPIRPHIFHLARGLRWRWHGKTWMALGGAHSVDRPMRKSGVSWWPQERLTEADVARAIRGGPVDVIVAHDAPDGYEIPGLPGGFPPAELYQADLHRKLVGEVVDATRPAVFYHGHYHVRYTAQRGETRVIGLAADGGSFVKSAMLLDLTA